MRIRTNRLLGCLTLGLIALASPALADQHEKSGTTDKTAKSAKSEPSPETRAKMADAHQKMAECLRSTRPVHECHAEMHKAQEAMEGGHGKAEGSMGHHGHGADDAAKTTAPAATTK